MLPISTAFGDLKKLIKWGPVIIPDITLRVQVGFLVVVYQGGQEVTYPWSYPNCKQKPSENM